MKNGYNALWTNRQPGPIAADLGGRVEQYYALIDDVSLQGAWGGGKAQVWAEALSANGAEVLMRYGSENSWLADQPAVLTRKVGQGRITYIGALLDRALMQRAIDTMAPNSGLHPPFGSVPEDVEVCRRTGPAGDVFVLINYGKQSRNIKLPAPMRDLLTGGPAVTSVDLPQYGVAVMHR
jgi:beta-galactosidase